MIEIINGVMSALGIVLQAILLLLPTSPFNFTSLSSNQFIQFINYILPLSQAVAHLSAYILAVIGYYAIRIVLRWVKASGS